MVAFWETDKIVFPLKGFVLKRSNNYYKPHSFGRDFDPVFRKLIQKYVNF